DHLTACVPGGRHSELVDAPRPTGDNGVAVGDGLLRGMTSNLGTDLAHASRPDDRKRVAIEQPSVTSNIEKWRSGITQPVAQAPGVGIVESAEDPDPRLRQPVELERHSGAASQKGVEPFLIDDSRPP